MTPLESLIQEQAAEAVARQRRILVTLSNDQVKEALTLAQRRNGKERHYGAMTCGARLTGIQAHTIGVIAEAGVASYYGVELDELILPGGDDGIDLVLPGLGKTGIKCSTYGHDPYLRVEQELLSEEVAAYLLCYVEPTRLHEVWLIGWATREEVEQGRKVRFVPGGPVNHLLEELELRRIE
jgi:hypothetical protein